MITLRLVLELLAFLAFVAATFGVASRINLIAGGLALWLLSILIGH